MGFEPWTLVWRTVTLTIGLAGFIMMEKEQKFILRGD